METLESSNINRLESESVGWDFVWPGDKRVTDWPLMNSPLPLFAILGLYLLTVYRWSPAFMQNREAYDLKWLLAIYNLFQVFACCYLILGILSTEFNIIKFWKCQTIDYANNIKSVAALSYLYQTFHLKLFELVETVFFVLRKKQNQVSKLHVYHHVSTAILGWIVVKYSGGGMILFSVVINCFVHVIMYSYYFAALLGPAVRQKLEGIKKNITLIQMIQFTTFLLQGAVSMARGCDVPKVLLAIYVPNIIFLFYMFYGFFKIAYNKKAISEKAN